MSFKRFISCLLLAEDDEGKSTRSSARGSVDYTPIYLAKYSIIPVMDFIGAMRGAFLTFG